MQEAKQANAESAQLKDMLRLLNAPDTIVRVTSEGVVAKPQGKVFLNAKEGVLLMASNLPPAPEGKTYEMWIIPAGGKPVPAGLFQTDPGGTAVYLQAEAHGHGRDRRGRGHLGAHQSIHATDLPANSGRRC